VNTGPNENDATAGSQWRHGRICVASGLFKRSSYLNTSFSCLVID
jgi:hypothetical protein